MSTPAVTDLQPAGIGRRAYPPPSACVSLVARVLSERPPGRGWLRATGSNGGSLERRLRRTWLVSSRASCSARPGEEAVGPFSSSEHAGIGKTRAAVRAGGRARGTGFEVLIGRSIDLVTVSTAFAVCRRPATARRSLAGRQDVGVARSCGCSRRRSRSDRGAAPDPCCWCSRTCIGPIPRRSISSCSSRTTLLIGRFCCLRPPALTSSHRPSVLVTACRRRPALGIGDGAGARAART